MAKAESEPNEKTILGSMHPGALAPSHRLDDANLELSGAVRRAARAAADGSEATRQKEAAHGGAAYSAARGIGVLDGGSVAGCLIFEGIEAGIGAER